jgi:peptidoglycan hydrolase-like protein with peptidoglycan-binding domain
MMKRLLLCICVCVLLLSTSLAHALQDLNLLDTSDAVRLYKADLIAAGYLSVDEAGSDVFNRRTKEATIELQKDYGLVETGLASPELQVIVRLLAKIENRGAIPEITPPPSPKVPDVRNMKRSDAIVSIQAIGQLPIVQVCHKQVKNFPRMAE